MDDIEFDHFSTAFENLLHNLNGFFFTLRFVNTLHFEVRLAMFHDQVHRVLLVDNLEEFDHIWMVDVSKDIDFVFESVFYVQHEVGMSVFESGQFDFFDCKRKAVVNFSERTRGDYFLKHVLVVADDG